MSFLQRLLEIRNGRRLSVLAPSRTAGLARQSGSVVVSALLIVAALAIPARAQNGSENKAKPKSDISTLPEVARERISAALGRDRAAYKTTAQTGGFRVENPRHGLSADFTSSGVDFHAGANQWGMTLNGYGHGDNMHALEGVTPHAVANRVEYDHSGLTEWYENGPFGLEQGFTFACAPGKSQGQPLTLALTLSGKLSASIDPDRRGLTLRKNGTAALRYAGLAATDANGRQLPAWMEVTGSRLQLRVDDSRARYPVTVDPLVQAAQITASDGTTYDGFGGATSLSADGGTLVVGASQLTTDGPGTAYVFLRPTQGWATTSSFAAKLTASDGASGDRFGSDVAISGNGSTVAVLAPIPAAVYVFVEPTGGWTSSSPLDETYRVGAAPGIANVSLSGDGNILAAGVLSDPDKYPNLSGEVEVFFTSDRWNSLRSAQLTTSVGGHWSLGASVRISGDGNTIVAGEPAGPGTAYVFTKPANGWGGSTETAILTASDAGQRDDLGSSVGITGDGSTIVAGAPGSESFQGAVYVFAEGPAGWVNSTEVAKLTRSAVGDDCCLGGGPELTRTGTIAISTDGSTVVAATALQNSTPGTAYLFVKPGGGWASSTETAKLPAPSCCTGSTKQQADLSSVNLSAQSSRLVYRPPYLTVVLGTSDLTVGSNFFQGSAFIFTGYAVSSSLVFSLGNLGFASAAGTISSAQPITLTNSGTAPLGISSVAATGPFSSTQNCVAASPIAPGASCIEYVTFAASGVGTFTGTLTFTDDAGEVDGSTQQVTLAGMGTQASTTTTIISVSPNPALVGQSVTAIFSVAPPAGDTLTPSGTVTVKASTGESCTGAAPSGSCSLTFSTAVTRTISANYAGDSNFLSSMSAAVSEVVTDFSLTVTPATQTIPSGHDGVYTLTLSPINGLTGTISLACSGGPPNSTCTVSPSSIALAGSAKTATGTVSLLPPKNVDHGTFSLTFTASDGALIHAVTVSLTVK
jgi:hypothetical protein